MKDYLRSIFRISESFGRVSTQEVADGLGVSPASVTSMIKRLAELGLIQHQRYRGVTLTEAGRRAAGEIIRHHRLLEAYLAQALGFQADEVHAEAARLEHVVSEQLQQRMDNALGRPALDPHGSPIPPRSAEMGSAPPRTLATSAIFSRLQILTSPPSGLIPGEVVVVLGRPRGAQIHVRRAGGEELLSPELGQRIEVKEI